MTAIEAMAVETVRNLSVFIFVGARVTARTSVWHLSFKLPVCVRYKLREQVRDNDDKSSFNRAQVPFNYS